MPVHQKLPKLPKDARVTKRPLLRPPIPSPRAAPSSAIASQQTVYIQTGTPFMSAVRRVRALLRAQDKRAGQSARDRARRGVGGGGGGAGKRPEAGRRQHDLILAAARAAADGAGRRGEAVVVRGAGRAVDKVLRLAAWFDGRAGEEGVAVRLATGSVAAIDDIVAPPPAPPVEGGEAGEPLPESRVRQASVLEARISRR